MIKDPTIIHFLGALRHESATQLAAASAAKCAGTAHFLPIPGQIAAMRYVMSGGECVYHEPIALSAYLI